MAHAHPLEVEALACRRGGRVLFDGLGFHAGAGELVTVRGANGAGKTSLLRLLVGLGIPDSGEVRWRGHAVGGEGALLHGELAWVGHADGIKLDLTPRENLEFHGRLHGVTAGVDQALALCGLAKVAELPCRALSAGQRRRTALARLQLVPATLWVLDEPLTALDTDGQSLVAEMVDRQCAGGGIVMMTSHQVFAGMTAAHEVCL